MLNFGQIRSRVQDDAGLKFPAARVAGWIDEAQIEISKQYGVRLSVYFPYAQTALAADIALDATEIPLIDATQVPFPHGSLRVGNHTGYEEVDYKQRIGDEIVLVTRGVRGTEALPWPAGTQVTLVAVAGVEYDLPADFYKMHEVRDEESVPDFDYQITGDNKIMFYKDGSHRLVYTKVPVPIDYNENGSRPEVHDVFHPAIVTYCMYKHWASVAEGIPAEENKAKGLRQEFADMVQETARDLKRNAKQSYSIGFKLWG